MSIHVSVVGPKTEDLERLVRASGMFATAASSIEILNTAHAGAQPADVVVVDLREQSTMPPALALLKKEFPAIGLVIVATTLEPWFMLEATRAGVSEYVVAPVRRTDLAGAIARVAGGPRKAPGQILAMIGVKGGVGVTTIAVNVATALARRAPGSVLLIDLNPANGDAAVFLGVDAHASTLDALENSARLDETFLRGFVTKTHAGLDLLASPARVIPMDADPESMRAVVEAASRCYRYVVLDVSGLDPSVGAALELATSITVVCTQDVAALRNGHALTTFLRQRYGDDRIQVVLNRFDRSAEIGEADVEIAMGDSLSGTFTSAHRLAVDSLNRGRPIVLDSQGKLAGEFRSYARALVPESEPVSLPDRSRLIGIPGGRRKDPPTE